VGLTALDTCVLARFIVRDDPVQSPLATECVRRGGFVPITVVLELVWLLRSQFGYTRAQVAGVIDDLVEMPQLIMSDADHLGWVAERLRAGADPADLIHLIASRHQDTFLTFDKMAQKVGPDTPISIELLR
jgi:predicted nucleic-acid-binding protein